MPQYELAHAHQTYAARGPGYRLPNRKGHHDAGTIPFVTVCTHVCLQPEEQSRAAYQVSESEVQQIAEGLVPPTLRDELT
jgi:hypothetical protein